MLVFILLFSFFLSFYSFFLSFLFPLIFSLGISRTINFLTSRHLIEDSMRVTSMIVASQNYTETDNEFRDTCRYSCIDSAVRVCLIILFRRVIDNVIIDFREIRLVGCWITRIRETLMISFCEFFKIL